MKIKVYITIDDEGILCYEEIINNLFNMTDRMLKRIGIDEFGFDYKTEEVIEK